MKRASAAPRGLLIELQNITLRRGGRRVLCAVNWTLAPRQRWVLLGANGAGKTQLLKLLAGDVWPSPDGRGKRSYHWRGERLTEPQDVKSEIAYLGSERQDRHAHYEWNYRASTVVGSGLQRSDIPLAPFSAANRRLMHRALRICGVAALANRRFLTLSYGQRRLVLLARALAWRAPLLLLDELFAGLDATFRLQVHDIVAGLARRDASWVISTHREEDIPRSATHLLWLRHGRVAWQGTVRAARTAGIVGRSGNGPAPARRRAATRQVAAGRVVHAAAPVIQLRNAWVWLDQQAVLRRLSFTIGEGECWVVHGPNGCGKSTLVRALYGDIGVASQGSVRRRGITLGVPLSEFKRTVGIVAPELQSLHPLYLTALEVVVSGLQSSIGLDQPPTVSERRRALSVLGTLRCAALAPRALRTLSYGQVRRVLFARALVHRPAILLLDEPYSGLDTRTRRALQRRMESLASRGMTMLITTHHADEWPRAASHELQLAHGAALYCGPVRTR